MKYFDFSLQTAEVVKNANSLEEKLSARTSVGRELFPAAIRKAGLHLLQPGDEVDLLTHPDSLVIGVATWSNQDMNFLDEALEYLRSRQSVLIFDIDTCQALTDIAKFMPNTSPPKITPVIAEYIGGRLIHRFEGKGIQVMLSLWETVKAQARTSGISCGESPAPL